MALLCSVTIPNTGWMWISAVLLVVIFASLIWTYRRARAINPGNKAAFVLKLLGVSILALCLIEPLWISRRAIPGANLFVVVADNSGSMSILDRGMTQSRGEILREIIDVNSSELLGTLADDFQIRQYIFDSRVSRTNDFSELTFDGKASSVVTALRTIAERYNNRPLAGILLLSDGIATDMIAQSYDFSDLPGVYPVVIGGPRPQKDISLNNVSVSQSSFEDAPVTIQADVETVGYTGKTIAIDLTDSSGQLVERQTQDITRKDKQRLFTFRLRPDKTGILFYKLEVKEKTETGSSTQSDKPPEATMVNNQRTLVVDRGGGPYRILYVTGGPNWEYKFLRRAISEDEQLELVALMRVARREPKFNWIGRRGETSNPLYRGFDNTNREQTEQYDQPVLVRLNTRNQEELSNGFPANKEELFAYHAIILDDVEAEFFSPFQMDLIRRFVAERGGGFLMLGGKESFQQGNFTRTAVGQILPVYLDRLPEKIAAGKMHLDLTREGWLQPWARLHENEIDEKQRISEMPAFRVLNRLPSVKPGASVVATIGNDWGEQFPALIVQRFGNGRTGALTIGDLWRWGLKESQMHEKMNKFWRQTLRWLVADVPERISLQASIKQDQVNQPVLLQVRARDKDFEPKDDTSVAIQITDPLGKTTQLTAEPVYDETGLYEATYIPRINGGYLAQVRVKNTQDYEIGDAQTGWSVDLDDQEFKSIKTDRPFLETLAKQTGGRIVELHEIGTFANSLAGENAPVTETWIRPLWETRGLSLIIFAIILICLTGEWTLRRWKGMP
jgi:uncharacterized membrane protein